MNIHEHIFSIIGGELDPSDGMVIIDRLCGTGFPIDERTFLTAGHVATQAKAYPGQWLGFATNGKIGMVPIEDIDIVPGSDVAVLRAPGTPAGLLVPWRKKDLSLLQEVAACGYPFGYDPQYATVSSRALRGSIVGGRSFRRLADRPRVYELSFSCPRGLSGAPLISIGREPRIAGMVIGNESTEMNIFTDKEVVTDGVTTIVERYESLQYGIALMADALLNIESRLLDGSLESFLKRVKRLEE